ncbi:MAG: Xaa-Pro peptidase family protein [Ignavibacteriales bacterium]|nr:Xaa-Pro peptidase family protein [Ignavibacteriales bacterium]
MRLRSSLTALGLDSFVTTYGPSLRYLTGYSGSHGICIVAPERVVFGTDFRYASQIETEVVADATFIQRGSLVAAAAGKKSFAAGKKAGIEAEHCPVSLLSELRSSFGRIKFRETSGLVEELASIKEPAEIECIRQAAAITDSVFTALLGVIKPGIAECEIAGEISFLHRQRGAEGDAFESIVASGVRGSLPHGRASTKKIAAGEFVTLDFGCLYRGYNSDLTRTIAVGSASREMRRVYRLVLDAQRRAIDAARSGMAARSLDRVARGYLQKQGYGKYFGHGLGHGLGLEVHAYPKVSAISTHTLQEGNVVTIEPGVYLPGKFGIRIEDDVVINRNGCTLLTSSPKQLLIL